MNFDARIKHARNVLRGQRRGDGRGGRAGRGGEGFFEEDSLTGGADGEDASIESNGSVRGAVGGPTIVAFGI